MHQFALLQCWEGLNQLRRWNILTVAEEVMEGWWLKLACLDCINRWDNTLGKRSPCYLTCSDALFGRSSPMFREETGRAGFGHVCALLKKCRCDRCFLHQPCNNKHHKSQVSCRHRGACLKDACPQLETPLRAW